MKRPDVDDAQVARLYTVEHLTVRQIGARFGMSGTAIWKRLKRAGVSAYEGEHVQAPCAHCGDPVERTRATARGHPRAFCSQACYFAIRANPNLIMDRWSGMQARRIVAEYFNLRSGYVVHHEDTNERNNALGNLRVFASQSDHLRYHHGKPIDPIWDGRKVSPKV